jgi:dinuclear metal center YbgI/SA1388 family protein
MIRSTYIDFFMTVNDIMAILEEFAPLALQESYDNSGLQTGDPEWEIERVLICLDVNDEVLEEAIQGRYQLIISHHPLIFKPIKTLFGKSLPQRILQRAIKHDVAIYAIHTNIDQASHGLNFALAETLGLTNLQVLSTGVGTLSKVVTYCPVEALEKVRIAMFDAGAGQMGAYDQCSFQVFGEGTFRALKGAIPYVGQVNKMHKEPEYRLEMVVPSSVSERVVDAMIKAHPYEEVAYDVVGLLNADPHSGAGVWGTFTESMVAEEFLQHVKVKLGAQILRHTKPLKPILRVGVCGGSGAFLITTAKGLQLDAFISADLKYHDFSDSNGGLLLVDAGHYETEIVVTSLLCDIITKKFPNFAVQITRYGSNPVRYS